MFFQIVLEYHAGTEDDRSRYLQAHVDYLKDNISIILAAGGLLNDEGDLAQGALYVVETESRAKAEEFINADPFVISGVVKTISITRWRRSFFNFEHIGGPGFVGAAPGMAP